MALTVTIELPPEVEQQLAHDIAGLSADTREALAVQLFRRGKINHRQLSSVLGVDRFSTDAVLKRYNVEENALSRADIDSDSETLRRVLGQAGR